MGTHTPTPEASVRPAVVGDAGAVGAVQAAVWRAAYQGVLPEQVVATFHAEAFSDVWRASLAEPPVGAYRLLVALDEARVVGFLALGPSQDPDTGQTTAEVLALGVEPTHRRQGHGSRLLNAAVDTIRDLGGASCAVWVLADDEDTRLFLHGGGLGPDGAWRDRVIDEQGGTIREVRLIADVGTDEPALSPATHAPH